MLRTTQELQKIVNALQPDDTNDPINLPEHPVLFPYQKEGARWLANQNHAYLADEMGLGKSAQAIRAADFVGAERILVLCPAIARPNWVKEFAKFSFNARIVETLTQSGKKLNGKGITICSFDLAVTSYHNSLMQSGVWDLVIIDEAHFLKNLETIRTKKVLGKNGIIRKSKKVWCLSGTPTPNHPGEFWPILYTFGITKLDYHAFLDRYCIVDYTTYGIRILGSRHENLEELRASLKGFLLRREKSQVMKQLPLIHYGEILVEPGEIDIDIDPTFIQYVFPTDRRNELEQTLKSQAQLMEDAFKLKPRSADMLQVMAGLSQSLSTLRMWTAGQKVQGVVELVTQELEAHPDKKIVIFAIHMIAIEGIFNGLKKFHPVKIYGGTHPAQRQRKIDNFQHDPKYRVFIGNIQACGTAITLTAAHDVLMVEQSWTPGDNAQAIMRVHRIGQRKQVYVRCVGIANSIDEKISAFLRRKTADFQALFGDRGLKELSIDVSPKTESKLEKYVSPLERGEK